MSIDVIRWHVQAVSTRRGHDDLVERPGARDSRSFDTTMWSCFGAVDARLSPRHR
ncbi:hypothetical protein ACQP2T_04170 [Nonomuraea sp. CA-143628]|uniref:hypothetical protein n=1 Tax=Nonomuraea sp. CA-143628 TaxID=3239997 RepID=UPI003D8E217A